MAYWPTERSGPPARQPAVPVAVCFSAGILLDHYLAVWTWWSWCLLAAGAVAAALFAWKHSRGRMVAASLLAAGVCLGGLRHHVHWSLSSPDDISRFLTEESRLVRLRGVVADPSYVKPRSRAPFQSAIPRPDVTIVTLDCEALQDRGRFVPVEGRVQTRISGRLAGLRVGDRVEVTGWMARPFPVANPGDFDFADYLKRQKIPGIVRIQQPEAVTKLPEADDPSWGTRIDKVRLSAEGVLRRHLSERNARIAGALLLGTRTELPEEIRDDFAETGMMHVLALSGLHVGILAMLVMLLCRLVRLSPRKSIVLMFAAVVALAVISGGRPPIIRATVFLGIASLGSLSARLSHPFHVLALAALVILVWNPADLFDVGTQLSFLAVMGILMTISWRPPFSDRDPLAAEESQPDTPLRRLASAIGKWAWRYACLTIGIWLMTAPLIAAKFHLISPVGILLNSFLVPLVVLVLWCGYLLLFVGGLIPPAAGIFAMPLEAGLSFLLGSVEWGAGVRWGHLDVAGPPTWWLAGYYLFWAGLYFLRPKIARPVFAGMVLLLGWTALGMGTSAWPSAPQGLRATFLSVGHGAAVLVEFPNGKTLLYDAGALDDGERAARVIRQALWRRGITRLDALALSHPDLDHVNAAPRLTAEIPVGTVLVAKSFFQSPQEVVPYLVDRIREQNIPIRTIGRDDRLPFDPSVEVEVKHPDPRTFYAHINANSLVLRLTHAGRSLLLVGDVELAGLSDLMAHDPGRVDVLQAPHHGSKTANTPIVADWANPAVVIASTGHVPGRLKELQTLYGSSTRLLTTSDHGAVTVEISPSGHLSVESFR